MLRVDAEIKSGLKIPPQSSFTNNGGGTKEPYRASEFLKIIRKQRSRWFAMDTKSKEKDRKQRTKYTQGMESKNILTWTALRKGELPYSHSRTVGLPAFPSIHV